MKRTNEGKENTRGQRNLGRKGKLKKYSKQACRVKYHMGKKNEPSNITTRLTLNLDRGIFLT